MKPLDKNAAAALLLDQFSKASCVLVGQSAVSNPALVKALVQWLNGKDKLLAQRAAWVVGLLGDHHADLFLPYMDQLLQAIRMPHHDAVARNIVRLWQFIDIKDPYLGDVFEVCFELLSSAHQAVAIRAFSATVCGKICVKYPELANELKSMIPVWSQSESPAMKVRLRELSKQLEKLT